MVLQSLLFALKGIPQVKYQKTIMIMMVSLLFSQQDQFWPKICPKTTPTLIFFAGFQSSMLGNSINVKNFNWNPVVPKEFC